MQQTHSVTLNINAALSLARSEASQPLVSPDKQRSNISFSTNENRPFLSNAAFQNE